MAPSVTYFASYKNRRINHIQRVQVYRNVNKAGVTYSIRDAKSKLVLGHTNAVLLSNCEFVVSEAGRQRVHREGKKNIHAWVEGTYVGPYYAGWRDDYGYESHDRTCRVEYSPWLNDHFVTYPDVKPVEACDLALIANEGIIAHNPRFKGN